VEGAPELVVEVTASRASYDLHDKLEAYRRNGVREYLVWRVDDRAVDWFVLWLDEAALLRGDLQAVLATLTRGTASAAHRAFGATLVSERSRRST
jgi:Uma2 family endonuclease